MSDVRVRRCDGCGCAVYVGEVHMCLRDNPPRRRWGVQDGEHLFDFLAFALLLVLFVALVGIAVRP